VLRALLSMVAVAHLLAGCDSVFDLERPPIDAAEPDALDAPVTMMPFDPPEPLSLNTPGEEDRPSLTDDMLEIYFHGEGRLYRSTRASTDEIWSPREEIVELGVGDMRRPCISGDGKTLYFSKGLAGQFDIMVSTRPARDATWGAAAPLPAPINRASSSEYCGWNSPDGLVLLFISNYLAGGENDIFRATRTSPMDRSRRALSSCWKSSAIGRS